MRAVMGRHSAPDVLDYSAQGQPLKQHASRKDENQTPAPANSASGGESETHEGISCVIGGASRKETIAHVQLHTRTVMVRLGPALLPNRTRSAADVRPAICPGP